MGKYTTSTNKKELSYNPMRPFVSQLFPDCSFSKLLLGLNKGGRKWKKGRKKANFLKCS